MTESSEMDYRSIVGAKGGSPKGTDKRRCPKELKEFARRWAIENIAGGNESYFINNPNAGTRFTARVFEPVIPLLKENFPAACEEYFGGRWDRAAHLIMNRVHKMYYFNDGRRRGRGKSREHPDYWRK